MSDWLRPIYELIRTQVMAEGYVQVDETPIRYLDPGGGKKPSSAICGQPTLRAATPSTTGRPAGPQPA
jgi:hypothetical protein